MTEYNFNTYKLKKFFEWSTDRTPLSYVKLSTEELKSSMRSQSKGVEVPARVREKNIEIEQPKEKSLWEQLQEVAGTRG